MRGLTWSAGLMLVAMIAGPALAQTSTKQTSTKTLSSGKTKSSKAHAKKTRVYDGRTLQPYDSSNHLRDTLGVESPYTGSSIGPSYGSHTLKRSAASTGSLGSTSLGPSYLTGGSLPLYNTQPAASTKTKKPLPVLPLQ